MMCACAPPYAGPMIRAFVERANTALGPTVSVSTPMGTWLVPRHFLALHRVALSNLPRLARRYHWRKEKESANGHRHD